MNGDFVKGVSKKLTGMLLVTGFGLAKGTAIKWSDKGSHR